MVEMSEKWTEILSVILMELTMVIKTEVMSVHLMELELDLPQILLDA